LLSHPLWLSIKSRVYYGPCPSALFNLKEAQLPFIDSISNTTPITRDLNNNSYTGLILLDRSLYDKPPTPTNRISHIANMAERYIPEHRRTQFKAKNTFKPEELRRRREEQQVEIRKAKREENLAKRRGIGGGESRPGASLGAEPDSDDDTAPTESQVS
jgi:hypothetical protein